MGGTEGWGDECLSEGVPGRDLCERCGLGECFDSLPQPSLRWSNAAAKSGRGIRIPPPPPLPPPPPPPPPLLADASDPTMPCAEIPTRSWWCVICVAPPPPPDRNSGLFETEDPSEDIMLPPPPPPSPPALPALVAEEYEEGAMAPKSTPPPRLRPDGGACWPWPAPVLKDPKAGDAPLGVRTRLGVGVCVCVGEQPPPPIIIAVIIVTEEEPDA